MELPGDISVTTVDVSAHAEAAPLAAGRGELTGLALWLMAERQKVGATPLLQRAQCLDSACVCEGVSTRPVHAPPHRILTMGTM